MSNKEALQKMCNYCTQNFADGKVDCKVMSCPVYKYMPYRNPNASLPKKVANEIINNITPLKARSGKGEYISYLKGEYIDDGKRIRAKCYYCMGEYADKIENCLGFECPLYKKNKANLNK